MEDFISQLLTEAGVPNNIDDETRQRLAAELTERASDLINRRLIDAMSEEDAVAFGKLLEEQPDNVNAAQQFITDHIPNRDKVVGAALYEFRALYLGTDA